MNWEKLIEKKDEMAKWMVSEITYIIKNFEKRDAGSKGEKQASDYMAKVLKEQCGCKTAEVESFQENPGAFYGWMYITLTCALLAIALFFFKPLISIILIVAGLFVSFMEFGIYKKFVDPLFKEKTGHNVTAIRPCTGEVKQRIFFNGHSDAAWEWPVNYKFGGVAYEAHSVIGFAGAFYYLFLSIATVVRNGAMVSPVCDPEILMWGKGGLIFAPFIFGLYWMWNSKRVVDGANDNLSGCEMGIAVLKAMEDEGMELEHTEVGVIITGSEEVGLRGAKAWAEAHKGEFEDVPTIIYAFDTIHDPKQLMVNYRDLNSTVKADKEAADLFFQSAKEAGVPIKKGFVPPLGGSTDCSGFTQGGFRAAGITGLDHKLEDYYHTRRDTYDNMNEEGLACCYAATVKTLENFDKKTR